MTAIGGAGSTITAATETTSDGIAVCNVTGTLAPQVNFQVVLPMESWTQRYLQVGCGGLCGNITLTSGASTGCKVLNDGGFVMAATDMGHTGNDGKWGLDETQRADFAYRAQHLTAEAAKALIAAFYGQPPQYSYFNGCSDGGREALMEAMRFPDDFDGVIAGAPAMLFQVQNTLYHGWMAASNYDADGEVILTSSKLPALHAAVVAACDESDGVTDGLIAQPALCSFDPQSIACAADAAENDQCLSPAQVEVVRKFYAGPQDAESGAYLTAGQPQYGSELEWQGVYVADNADSELFSQMIVDPVLKYLAFDPARPEMELADLKFTEATLTELRTRHPFFDATNPDLSAFEAAGGKLIMWHGLADPHISPANTLALHEGIAATLGADSAAGFERLYLLPGVGHCGGGQGPGSLDLLSPMMAWVEDGTAPEAVMTSSSGEESGFGQPDGVGSDGGERGQALDLGVEPLPAMTRPAYPYPHVASWSGEGDVNDSAQWSMGPATEIVSLRDWPGADFFTPYAFSE
ncbi:tannase/feruloyl esterase family alpha/beta hydrolase [Paracoccus aurantiacus]|nr:tannase/feruloyl esterase family alpha/beta hydrolase [Paracoccus aurantiacus]